MSQVLDEIGMAADEEYCSAETSVFQTHNEGKHGRAIVVYARRSTVAAEDTRDSCTLYLCNS